MPKQPLTLATSQSHTLPTTRATLSALAATTRLAASRHVDILLFPEAYLGGYPRTCAFGASIGARSPLGREQFLAYFHAAVDLGDTPHGAGEAWVERRLETGRDAEGKERAYRGDGVREELEHVAKETGVFIVVGVVERAGGSLYCACLYVCPRLGVVGKRRKVMPTGMERVVWAQGAAETLRAVVTWIKGVKVTMVAAICWESFMPLVRMSLYCQNVNLYLAPTADGRGNWEALMRTVGGEGRCFVVSANQCVRRRDLPGWINGEPGEMISSAGAKQKRRKSVRTRTAENHEITWPVVAAEQNSDGTEVKETRPANGADGSSPYYFSEIPGDDESPQNGQQHHHAPENHILALPSKGAVQSQSSDPQQDEQAVSDDNDDEFVSRGGSLIVGPTGDVLAGPLWEVDEGGLLIATVDFEDCERGRLDMDVAGSYGRLDSFELKVKGLDLSPPP